MNTNKTDNRWSESLIDGFPLDLIKDLQVTVSEDLEAVYLSTLSVNDGEVAVVLSAEYSGSVDLIPIAHGTTRYSDSSLILETVYPCISAAAMIGNIPTTNICYDAHIALSSCVVATFPTGVSWDIAKIIVNQDGYLHEQELTENLNLNVSDNLSVSVDEENKKSVNVELSDSTRNRLMESREIISNGDTPLTSINGVSPDEAGAISITISYLDERVNASASGANITISLDSVSPEEYTDNLDKHLAPTHENPVKTLPLDSAYVKVTEDNKDESPDNDMSVSPADTGGGEQPPQGTDQPSGSDKPEDPQEEKKTKWVRDTSSFAKYDILDPLFDVIPSEQK